MAKYILVYELSGYPDDGGGIYTQEFGMEEQKMHQSVGDLVKTHKDDLTIIYAGFLQVEYKYKAIEYAVRVEPIRFQTVLNSSLYKVV